MMNGYGSDMGWGWGMAFFSVLALLLIALAVVAIVLWTRHGGVAADRSGPRRILEERFAHGEIDEAEFQGRMKLLR